MSNLTLEKPTKETHECEICGHAGADVVWVETEHRPGYYCRDGEACFQRFREQRNREPGTIVYEDDGEIQ